MTSIPASDRAAPEKPSAPALADDLAAVRARTLGLIDHLGPEDLERQVDPIMSPLVWDLAHIAAYEDLWLVHRFAGLDLLHPELAAMYDAFETPRAVRGDLPLLDTAGALAYLDDVRTRVLELLDERGAGDGELHEMVLRHELQHTETMRQAMALGGLLPAGEPELPPMDGEDGWLAIPAGGFGMGARADAFAYDNERPRHRVEVGAFRIARRPVTNGAWRRFARDGGYERREWWSAEGWTWKEAHAAGPHPAIAAGAPEAPACHVSCFEAEAFARAAGARLPTEAEWERAATWHPRDLAHTGRVWEWTSTPFGGYPGFRAHPYPEYSEVFFGSRYRVLRGGSWATHPRVGTVTFRNWDLPQRRQIFAGVRLATEM